MKVKVFGTAVLCSISILSTVFALYFILSLNYIRDTKIDSNKEYHSNIIKDDRGQPIGIVFEEN